MEILEVAGLVIRRTEPQPISQNAARGFSRTAGAEGEVTCFEFAEQRDPKRRQARLGLR